MRGNTRIFGIALVLGGGLLILLNVFLTPLLPMDQGEAVLRTSTIYFWRLSAAGVTAVLLLLGCFGVFFSHWKTVGVFGNIAFLVAFLGNSLLVAVEWSNVFVLRAVAQSSPEALGPLDNSTLMTVGFASAAGLFTLGWIMLATSAIMSRVFPLWVPIAVISGLILIPVLGATPLGLKGAIVGNVVFGLGIMAMGWESARKGLESTPGSFPAKLKPTAQ